MIKEISVEQAKKLLTNPKMVLLDVRTSEEFNETHLNKSINIDINLPNFEEKISELDRNQIYLIFCRSGARSTAAMKVMQRLGFKNILCVQGWIF
ncbi:MAG: rhodanese-like domain-containing protein [Candidatus Woesearchaeota archaeon]